MAPDDPSLLVLPGEAKVGPVRAAGDARLARTGTAYHRDRQVSRAEIRDVVAYLQNLDQRLVAEHEVVLARRWSTVLEPRDLAIRAADAHLEHACEDLGRSFQARLGVIDDPNVLGAREDGERTHRCPSHEPSDPGAPVRIGSFR